MAHRHGLLPRISVTRPVTVVVLLAAILVVGFIAYTRIRIQLFPSGFDNPWLYLNVPYPNSTPQEAEQQIAKPLEEALRTVPGIKSIRTHSSRWGANASLEFRQGTDMALAYNQIMDRLERLKPLLPDAVDRRSIRVWKWRDDDRPIMWAGVSLNPDIKDPYTFIETHIQRPLQRIDGVAKVDIRGTWQKSVMIEVDQERARARRVNTYDLVQALRGDNFSLASGSVFEGRQRFYVRSMARYQDLREIEEARVGRNRDVRLREIATVTYDVPERWWYQRINGQPAASIGIFKESEADIVSLCREVERTIKQEIEKRPTMAGTTVEVFFNQGQFIEQSIAGIEEAAVWGGIFALLVIFFFLRAVRMTLIVTLAIPLCVLITIAYLYFVGWSLNLLTMMGLMLGIGMVVDDAIVIVENIYRMRGEGKEAKLAAMEGAGEVGLAVVLSTLTTVVVFLPLMLMHDNAGFAFYMSRMGAPVIVSILASLLVALLFIPLAASRAKREEVGREPASVAWMGRAYERSARWAMRHRLDAFLIALLLYASIQYPLGKVKRTDQSGGNINDISFGFEMPRTFDFPQTSEIIAQVEKFLEGKWKTYDIRTMQVWYSRSWGDVQVFLHPERDAWWYLAYKNLRKGLGIPAASRMPRQEVIADIQKNCPKFVGVTMRFWGGGGGGGGPSVPSVAIYLYGDDTDVLAELSGEAERRLRAIPEVVGVDTDLERGDDEVQVRVDREQARKYGITPQIVARTISSSLQGVNLPRFRAGDRDVDVRLSLEKSDRETLHQLKNFAFTSNTGQEIPLEAIATVTIHKGPGPIRRENGKTRLEIKAFTTQDNLKGLFEQIDRAMAGFEMPHGYRWDKGERYTGLEQANQAQQFALILAVVFVFLLMGVLFESFILPFSVLLSIPFSFLGVYWTLYLTDTPFDMMAMIGSVILIGVVVKNAIVLIDRVNQLRQDGMDRTEAIVLGGKQRLRPILMTTATTVFGWLPMAVGSGSLMGMSYAPMGRAMMGGMVVSTALTLLVVPLFYTLFDDLREVCRRAVVSLRAQGNVPVEQLTAADDD